MNSDLAGHSFNPGLVHRILSQAHQQRKRPWVKWVLIAVAIAYLSLILFIPALNVVVQAFKGRIWSLPRQLDGSAFCPRGLAYCLYRPDCRTSKYQSLDSVPLG
jgi:ABC-type Fe3+ transport system permease subunit